MNELQARTFFEARSGYTQRISRSTKAGLDGMYRDDLAEQGRQILFGGPATKQELISALVELHYPLARMNEAIHVLYHGEFANDACEHCAAVARVNARGSDPAAIAEAEGDFGPAGIFSA